MVAKRCPSILPLLAALAACGGTPAPRDQYAFGREWTAIAAMPNPVAAERAFQQLVQSWQGQEVSWEVLIIEPLCVDNGCYVRAWGARDSSGANFAALGGVLPRFDMDDAQFRKLTRACIPREGRCVARLQATLTGLPQNPDLPLRLGFTDTRVMSVRSARSGEHYFAPARQASR